jgi:hypothetical protein
MIESLSLALVLLLTPVLDFPILLVSLFELSSNHNHWLAFPTCGINVSYDLIGRFHGKKKKLLLSKEVCVLHHQT